MKKVLFLIPAEEGASSDPSKPQVTLELLTHYFDQPTEKSFVHPRGLLVLMEGAQIFDFHDSESGELRLDFRPGEKKPNAEIEYWTVIFPTRVEDQPSPPDEPSPPAE